MSVKGITIILCGLMLAACHKKEAAICNVGPPEDSAHYKKWADDITNAHCPGMHEDQNAIVAGNAVS